MTKEKMKKVLDALKMLSGHYWVADAEKALLSDATQILQDAIVTPAGAVQHKENEKMLEANQYNTNYWANAAQPVQPVDQYPVAWYEYNPSLDTWFVAYGKNPNVHSKTRPLVFGDIVAKPALTDRQVADMSEKHHKEGLAEWSKPVQPQRVKFEARCRLSEACLPDAPYRTMLTALHDEMLDVEAAQPAQPALQTAAQAVLDRWDSPQWEWAKHGPTADLMHALRKAITQTVQPKEIK